MDSTNQIHKTKTNTSVVFGLSFIILSKAEVLNILRSFSKKLIFILKFSLSRTNLYIKKSCLRQEGWYDLCLERFVDGFQLSNPLKWIFMKCRIIPLLKFFITIRGMIFCDIILWANSHFSMNCYTSLNF